MLEFKFNLSGSGVAAISPVSDTGNRGCKSRFPDHFRVVIGVKPRPTKIRKHKFFRKKYLIEWKSDFPWYGEAKDPNSSPKKRKIIINTSQSQKEMLDTLAHEALHALNYRKSEKYIRGAATSLASFLWRVGFRLKPSKNR